MIIEQKIQHDIVEDDFLTIESKVNQKKLAKLYGLLSNIYRNPIGAIVREYASNAYDANVEARSFATLSYKEIVEKYSWVKDSMFNMTEENFKHLQKSLNRVSEKEPVVVGITDIDNQTFFYVKDYGIGLSPERMKNIYFNYLDSTKEGTDDEIGGFGIGSKSALSYTHTFYIDTVYMGVSYKYIMSKNAEGIPQGQLLYVSDYDETLENGTTIKIKLKEGFDTGYFFSEVPKQLSYMDNLYFDNEYLKSNNYPHLVYNQRVLVDDINDFKLYRGDGWIKKSINSPYDELHICLGKVSYTIDWTELGMTAIKVPMALTFEIGELQPTPSRESILYNPSSIATIKSRIKQLQDFFINEYYKLFETTDDLYTFLDRRSNTITSVKVGDVTVDIDNLTGHRGITGTSKIKYKPFVDAGFKTIPSNGNMFNAYEIRKRINYNSARIAVNKYTNSFRFDDTGSHYISNIDGKLKLTFHRNAHFLEHVFKKSRDLKVIDKNKDYDYNYLLGLDYYSDEATKEKIVNIFEREIENYLNNISEKYRDYYPNPNWQHSFDAGKSRYSPKTKKKRLEGKIFCYTPTSWGSYSQTEKNLEDLEKFTGILMYDMHENKVEMLNSYMLLTQVRTLREGHGLNKNAVMCISVSKENYKIIKTMKNSKTPQEVLTGVRTFKRICTAMYIKDKMSDLSNLQKIEGCYDKLDGSYRKLTKYVSDNFENRNFHDVYISDEFITGMLTVAKNRNMIDESIILELKFLEEYNKGLSLLDSVTPNVTRLNPAMVEFLKLKGKKVSNKFYLKIDKK